LTTFGRRVLLWGPVVAYMAAIFHLSSQSSPPTPGGLPDTLAHAIEYFGLGVVVFRAVAGGLGARVTPARAMTTMIIAVAYAVSDEVHQLFVPDRTADARDLLADAAGASVALIACWAWNIIATSNRRGRP
jgi:VanZ family protein